MASFQKLVDILLLVVTVAVLRWWGLAMGLFKSAGAESSRDDARFFSIFQRGVSGGPLPLNVPQVCLDRLQGGNRGQVAPNWKLW